MTWNLISEVPAPEMEWLEVYFTKGFTREVFWDKKSGEAMIRDPDDDEEDFDFILSDEMGLGKPLFWRWHPEVSV